MMFGQFQTFLCFTLLCLSLFNFVQLCLTLYGSLALCLFSRINLSPFLATSVAFSPDILSRVQPDLTFRVSSASHASRSILLLCTNLVKFPPRASPRASPTSAKLIVHTAVPGSLICNNSLCLPVLCAPKRQWNHSYITHPTFHYKC